MEDGFDPSELQNPSTDFIKNRLKELYLGASSQTKLGFDTTTCVFWANIQYDAVLGVCFIRYYELKQEYKPSSLHGQEGCPVCKNTTTEVYKVFRRDL